MHRRANISDDAFVKAFPFGFIVDPGGDIAVLGRALDSRLPGVVGQSVDRLFELIRPTGPERLANAVDQRTGLVVLRSRTDGMQLRGQLVPSGDDGGFIFIGTASIRSVEDMRNHGVQLSDFAPQDATPDLLMILQANQASLEDARKLTQQLEVTAERARAASESKGKFLAVMSHEIRTTLNGLGAMVDILGASPLDSEQQEAIDVMTSSTEQLNAILNDVLDLSRIESGAVSVESIPFEVRSVCESVIRLYRASATQNGLELTLELAEGLDSWVEGDPTRVRQVLSNLVGNAIKFTYTGGVHVVVERDAAEADVLRFEVRDTGPGISEEFREHLFDPFDQASASVNRRFGGSGLGLTICRELVRLMGGEIDLLDSSPSGSTFGFTVKAPASAPEVVRGSVSEAVDHVSGVGDLDVLVAEDHPTNRRVLQRLLNQLDIEPTIVEDGAQAVDAVRAKPYDLVLMDLGMPVMDGATAARAIRSLDVTWSDLPIVACTAGVFREDREAAREAGMGGFLTKPIRLAHLKEALARVAAGMV